MWPIHVYSRKYRGSCDSRFATKAKRGLYTLWWMALGQFDNQLVYNMTEVARRDLGVGPGGVRNVAVWASYSEYNQLLIAYLI